jgi:hypothetical protein
LLGLEDRVWKRRGRRWISSSVCLEFVVVPKVQVEPIARIGVLHVDIVYGIVVQFQDESAGRRCRVSVLESEKSTDFSCFSCRALARACVDQIHCLSSL